MSNTTAAPHDREAILASHTEVVKTRAKSMQPGDRIIATGNTAHLSKRIIVTRVEKSLLAGYILVYGTSMHDESDHLIFRSLRENLPVAVAR